MVLTLEKLAERINGIDEGTVENRKAADLLQSLRVALDGIPNHRIFRELQDVDPKEWDGFECWYGLPLFSPLHVDVGYVGGTLTLGIGIELSTKVKKTDPTLAFDRDITRDDAVQALYDHIRGKPEEFRRREEIEPFAKKETMNGNDVWLYHL